MHPSAILRHARPSVRVPLLSTGSAVAAIGVLLGSPPEGHAQFGYRFASPDVVRPTLNTVYQHPGGRLVTLVETSPAREDGYLFVNGETGTLEAAFRLDARHGAMPSPDGREIRIAGTEQTAALEPVYFAGRYDAATLRPRAERQIAISKDAGYALAGEVGPDGAFVYRGANGLRGINVLAKYSDEFAPLWGLALTSRGQFDPLGLEAYPLANGDVGFLLPITRSSGANVTRWNVLGVVDGQAGTVRWTSMIETTQAGLEIDELRPVFGPVGGMQAGFRRLNLLSGPPDRMGLTQWEPDGRVAYHGTLGVPGTALEGAYHFGDLTLVYATYKEDGADRLQWVVLGADGRVLWNHAWRCQLRGGTSPKLAAMRREGTDSIFLRFEAGFTGGSPEVTLARLDVATGEVTFRRLTTGIGRGPYELVTTPPGDYLSPYNNQAGLVARGTALSAVMTHPVTGPGIVALYELPRSGAFPTCIEGGMSSITPAVPRAAQWSDQGIVPLAEGVTAVVHAMPAMTEAALKPQLAPLAVTVTTDCEDDPAAPAPVLSWVRVGTDAVEVRVATVGGFRYASEASSDLVSWQSLESRDGDGGAWTFRRSTGGPREFLRVSTRPR